MQRFGGAPKRSAYESMSRGDLIDELCRRDRISPDPEHLRARLELHQVELELQNEQLREQQQRLEESHAGYADLFDHAPVAYCVLDRDAVIRRVNAAAVTLFRGCETSLVGVPMTRVVEIGERQALYDHLARCIDDKRRVATELPMKLRDRGDVVMSLVSTPTPNGPGVVACRTLFNDVTRMKRAERELRFLVEIDAGLLRGDDLESLLMSLLDACLPTLGDASFVDLREADGTWRRTQRCSTSLASRLEAAGAHPAWCKYRDTLLDRLTPVFEPASASAPGLFDCGIDALGLLLVPLTAARGRAFGLLGMLMTSPRRSYSVHDFGVAMTVAKHAALAIDNASRERPMMTAPRVT